MSHGGSDVSERFIRQHSHDRLPYCDNAIQLDRFGREMPCAACWKEGEVYRRMDPLDPPSPVFRPSLSRYATTTDYILASGQWEGARISYWWEQR